VLLIAGDVGDVGVAIGLLRLLLIFKSISVSPLIVSTDGWDCRWDCL